MASLQLSNEMERQFCLPELAVMLVWWVFIYGADEYGWKWAGGYIWGFDSSDSMWSL